jgi:hypothetical protein
MISLERNALVTISPVYDHGALAGGEYRWSMNVSLPFPFPAVKCVDEIVEIGSRPYRFGIHNHFDRLIFGSKKTKGWFRSRLVGKTETPQIPGEFFSQRETLQAVATFSEQRTFSAGNDAFADAAKKITDCMEFLGEFLSKCQRRAPYLATWLVYPISAFEVGTIYHDVLHKLPDQGWHLCASSIAMSLSRHLQVPLFVLTDLKENLDPIVELTNELLAEALLSVMRGTTRLTVLNSYSAVENLAKTVLVKQRASNLKSRGTPDAVADELANEVLAQKKMDSSYLFHSQMKKETGRSLHEEKQKEYDALLHLQRIRNDVAHFGYRPTADEGRNGHRTACEVARWLCEVGGYAVKPMLPSVEQTSPQLTVFSKDAFAKSAPELAAIRELLGRVAPECKPEDHDAASAPTGPDG